MNGNALSEIAPGTEVWIIGREWVLCRTFVRMSGHHHFVVRSSYGMETYEDAGDVHLSEREAMAAMQKQLRQTLKSLRGWLALEKRKAAKAKADARAAKNQQQNATEAAA